MYDGQEPLQLSGIQHFVFCRRQWALIHIENQWAENIRTVEGDIFHQRAHNGETAELRGYVLTVRGAQGFRCGDRCKRYMRYCGV